MDETKISNAIGSDNIRPAIETNICEHCERKITRSISPTGALGPWIDGDDEIECPANGITCPLCRGSGNEEIDCDTCGGTGDNQSETDDADDEDCADCDGDGVDYVDCGECDGSAEWTGAHEPR